MGATFSGTVRMATGDEGAGGFFTGLQHDTQDNRYGFLHSVSNGKVRIYQTESGSLDVTLDGTGGIPNIDQGDWYTFVVEVPTSLGDATISVNGTQIGVIDFRENTGGTGSKVIISSGSSAATNRVYYVKSFGVDVLDSSTSDIEVTNATLDKSSFTELSASQYTVDVLPIAAGEVTVRVPAGVCQDADTGTINNIASNTLSIHFDNIPPSITSSATATAIDENSGSGQIVYTVTTNNTATYSLGTAGGDESAFSIDGTTGNVTLTANPDFETKSSYSFEVVATNDLGNASQQTVTLSIVNLNDNAPEFTSDSGTVSIAEGHTATGYTALATDADADQTIIYSITGGADHALFTITNGELNFASAPDYENPSDSGKDNTYVVDVQASDGVHTATQTETVMISDVTDETAPV